MKQGVQGNVLLSDVRLDTETCPDDRVASSLQNSSTMFAWKPQLLTRKRRHGDVVLLLTLGGSLHVRDTVASAHKGTYNEEEHPGTRGQLRAQADTEVMLLPLDRIVVNAGWVMKETCVSRRRTGDVALAETWKITHKRNGNIDHMLENA